MTPRTNASSPEDVQATFVATLVDEWARGGLRTAVVCPGSRSTPMALALADHPGIEVEVHHDERSGAFLALGIALASGRPSLVLTTSGTATAELHPAVVEAHHAGLPLLVCTADRPPELRDVGAPQTIDQAHLFGRAVRWFADPGVADAATAPRWRPFAARALIEALGPPAGPVHLNLPFREPLVGTPGELPPGRHDRPWTTIWGRAGSAEGTTAAYAGPADVSGLGRWGTPGVAGGGGWRGAPGGLGAGGRLVGEGLVGRRGLILAGYPSGAAEDLVRVAETLGWPVVADPRAEVWGATSPVRVDHLDAILRADAARDALRPEVILRLGGIPASRVVNEWVEWCTRQGADEIVVPGGGGAGAAWSDPAGTAAVVVPAPGPDALVAHLARQIEEIEVAGDTVKPVAGWLDPWRAASDAASAALAATVPTLPPPHEPGVARDVVAALPDAAQLVVSSSMPIRDVERYAHPRPRLRILANRGANGIDGVISTAVGAALARPGRVTGLLVGDLAFLHDSNGLLGIGQRSVDLVCVVVDNDGGGIFSFLPQARRLPGDRFESLFGTPHGLDLVALAAAYGVRARAVLPDESVGDAVRSAATDGGVHVLVVRTDRAVNVEAHRQLDEAIAAAVADALS